LSLKRPMLGPKWSSQGFPFTKNKEAPEKYLWSFFVVPRARILCAWGAKRGFTGQNFEISKIPWLQSINYIISAFDAGLTRSYNWWPANASSPAVTEMKVGTEWPINIFIWGLIKVWPCFDSLGGLFCRFGKEQDCVCVLDSRAGKRPFGCSERHFGPEKDKSPLSMAVVG
jgi:hypothetical protein